MGEPGLAMTDSSGLAVEITFICFTISTLIATTEPCTSPWTGSLAPTLAAKRRYQRSGTARSLERRPTRPQCTPQVPKPERLSDQPAGKRNTHQNANTQYIIVLGEKVCFSTLQVPKPERLSDQPAGKRMRNTFKMK